MNKLPIPKHENDDSATDKIQDSCTTTMAGESGDTVLQRNGIAPVTPEKVINEKSNAIPVSGTDNWEDLIGMYTGLLQEETIDKRNQKWMYFKTNDPANWKCNHLASVVERNNGVHLSNRQVVLQIERNNSLRSTQTQRFNFNNCIPKDELSTPLKPEPHSSPFAPITPANQKNSPRNVDSPPSAENLSEEKTTTRRRKHRPKVIRAKKDPTKVTPPGETRVKRKYVRKKGLNISETPGTASVAKRKYVRKKGIQNLESQHPVFKSCKRQLNFDQEESHDITKHGLNLNFSSQETRINKPQQNNHIGIKNIVFQPNLDEKRGIKRHSSAMDSLFMYQKLLLGVAHRAHDRNIFLENHKKIKIEPEFQRQMNRAIYNPTNMVNFQYQPHMIRYGVTTYPHSKGIVGGQGRVERGEFSVDYLTYKLKCLRIYDDKRKEQNELVVYRGSDVIVPYEPIKKRNQRPKVNLDPETNRLWRLLMEKDGSEGGETLDKDKEKWWEHERKVFRGRADSFIARMHLVQGDRRFSRWKGSVVDSVIGVFLTQNVSDHLSSSAFMSLAAKFPIKTCCEEPIEVAETKDILKCQENSSNKTVDEISLSSENVTASFETSKEVTEVEKSKNDSQKIEENPINVEEEQNASHEQPGASTSKERKRAAEDERNRAMNWDNLRKKSLPNGEKKEQSKDAKDSIDYEALRHAPINEISDAIKERGMNNLLADRMKDFLNRVVRDHGKIDLEWLRDAPPDKAKEYLLSFRGLGLKSVECVRLLTLHHLAFPVDTNVGRIAVRLGWVPLQPLPESLQLHLLEMYPVLDSIQKYLWPRLCKLDQLTLYELHYQMITFGKVFCTKSKPNCNACPMRAECRHFASAFASARLALPGPEENPEEKRIVNSDAIKPMPLAQAENDLNKNSKSFVKNCEPIIEEPTTPEPEATELSLSDIEDQYYEDSDEIPSIKLNMEEFTNNLQNIMQESKELQKDMSKALVALNPNSASIPTPKLKDVSRLRTEHQVYELPDSHRLLEGLEKREADDPSPYLLAIWTPGETANSVQPPEKECSAQESGGLCDRTTCFSCNNIKEANSQVVRGTILIPCRTAMRGSFPLNGTYFQVNEMFADHASSLNPIDVPRAWIWNLPRRTVYFGTSVSTIFRGLSTQGIQYCFWKGFVCVRGFDRKTRAPRPLMARLHFPPSKLIKTKNEGK